MLKWKAMLRPPDPPAEILVLGDLNVDIIARVGSFPHPGEECLASQLELHCGGVGANCAFALRRWNISPRFVACVGQDVFAAYLLKTLASHGVNLRNVQHTSAAHTGLLYINVTRNGQRTFFGSRGANRFLRPLPTASPLLRRTMAVSMVGYSFLDPRPEAAAQQLLKTVRALGGWVSLDIGMAPCQQIPGKILRILKHVDLLFVSSDEAALLTGLRDPRKSFRRLEKAGARQVVMKLGKRGSVLRLDGQLTRVPAFAVPLVDSTGAGDAFAAAFLQARLRAWPDAEAALAANAAGAASAAMAGAGENMPSLRQIARILRAQPLKDPWDLRRSRILRRIGKIRFQPASVISRAATPRRR
jgi:sugar/nucleoside kinase (ribokinase family)